MLSSSFSAAFVLFAGAFGVEAQVPRGLGFHPNPYCWPATASAFASERFHEAFLWKWKSGFAFAFKVASAADESFPRFSRLRDD